MRELSHDEISPKNISEFDRRRCGPAGHFAPAGAEAYPSRPVHIIVPVPPGGALDIIARLMGQWLSDHLGQTFIIENRPGAAPILESTLSRIRRRMAIRFS